jgi:integrase
VASERREHGTGSVFFESARRRWVGTFDVGTTATGRRIRRRVTARTKGEVIAKLRQLRRDAGIGGPRAHGSMTLGDLLDRWLEKAAPNRLELKSTLSNYRRMCDLARAEIGAVKLAQLGPDDIERMLRSLAEDGYAKTTLQRVRTVVGLALRWAVKRRYAAWDATTVAELPPDASITSKRVRQSKSLTADEARRFASAALERRNGLALVLAMALGLRPGEMTALRWTDLDEDSATLHVGQAWKDADEHRRLGVPKTRRSVRTIGVPSTLVLHLTEHRRTQREEAVALGWRDELGLMFVSDAGTPLDPANLRRLVRGVANAADVGNVTPYMLRHTAASLLADDGARIESVADLLGHSDSRTTERYYTHRVRPSVDTAVAAMDAFLEGVSHRDEDGSPMASLPSTSAGGD